MIASHMSQDVFDMCVVNAVQSPMGSVAKQDLNGLPRQPDIGYISLNRQQIAAESQSVRIVNMLQ